MSFYRKYRPQKLTEIVGQSHIRQTFLNALKKGGLTHAYLFTGSRGTGKTSTARIIARALNCLTPDPDGEPCNKCEICAEALAGRLVDLIEIDAASNRGIDEMRELRQKILFTPSRAKAKIYIIDEVHMLTKEAFNALLKTLEEPPDHAYFILATTEPHKIPETIISRTQRFDFHRIAESEIVSHLAEIAKKEEIKFVPEALQLVAKQSVGGMRDAIGMLEQLGSSGEITVESVAQNLGLTRPQAVEDFTTALLSSKLSEALDAIAGLVAEGANLIQFNKTILAKLREIMLAKISENSLPEAKRILGIINEFTQAGEELKNAIIPQLPLEVAVIAVCSGGVQAASVVPKNIPAQESPAPAEVKKAPAQPKPEQEVEKKLAAVEEEAVAQKIPEGSLSIPEAESVIPQVLGKIQNPTVKMVVKGAKIVAVTDSEIEIGVGSDFLAEKLDSSARSLLAEKFSEILGRSLQIKVSRVEIEIQSAAPEAPSPASPKAKTVAEAADGMFEEGW